MDAKKLEQAARLIIEGIGENPNREGLIETPKRFAKMLMEQLEYASVSNDEIAKKFNKCFSCDNDDMVVLKGINCFSYCEHHIALMYNMTVDVGYIPNGKVIGKEIRDILIKILGTEDVIVVIQGEHSCMTARGIKKPGVKTKTASCGGQFLVNAELRKEFYLVNSK